jgi:hypothetical protein
LATRGEEGGELRILIDDAERVSDLHVRVAAGEGGASHSLGFLRDLIDGVRV